MQAQAKHRFTVEDYYRMAETGVLKPDARVELLNGEIVDMTRSFAGQFPSKSACIIPAWARHWRPGILPRCLLAPFPCAISATFHSVIGSILAGIWRLRPARKPGGTKPE
jgi:hypothetical protein